jgi:hypothetical protein
MNGDNPGATSFSDSEEDPQEPRRRFAYMESDHESPVSAKDRTD